MKGVLIIAHGSRTIEANEIFADVVQHVKNTLTDTVVIGSSMKFTKLNIKDSLMELINKGIMDITIVPYFLFDGEHVTVDIPKEVDEILKNYPKVVVSYTTSIGKSPKIKDIVVDLIAEEKR